MPLSKSSLTFPAAGLLIALLTIAAGWYWMGRGVPMPEAPLGPNDKLQCVSYAPFRGLQSPFDSGVKIERWQIEDDFTRLKQITDCVRTYSTGLGLDQAPEIARSLGLKMLLGIWLNRERDKNEIEIEKALALAKKYPDVISALVVGNEVLLRGELSAQTLTGIIRDVRARAGLPVTYADVWEFWTRYREVSDAVDFVTVHILPYWEDFPIPASTAAAHVASIRRQVAGIFPGKEILIGETGWPSQGRMREGALPSPSNQARVIQEILAAGKRENFRINVIEAFDQPWKRLLEGTVGGHWGLLDGNTREPKFEWGAPVSDHPSWLWQAAGGLLLALCAFGAAFAAHRDRAGDTGSAGLWAGVTVNAVAGGLMAGLAFEKMLMESLGAGGWVRSIALVIVSIAVPVVASAALAIARPIPAFSRVLARSGERISGFLPLLLGLLAIAATLLAVQAALGLAFDPRYKDFPFPALTSAAIPLAVLMVAMPREGGRRGAAEIAAAGLLILAAGYIALNEGFANWQSLWFCAAIAVLALTLLRVRDARD